MLSSNSARAPSNQLFWQSCWFLVSSFSSLFQTLCCHACNLLRFKVSELQLVWGKKFNSSTKTLNFLQGKPYCEEYICFGQQAPETYDENVDSMQHETVWAVVQSSSMPRENWDMEEISTTEASSTAQTVQFCCLHEPNPWYILCRVDYPWLWTLKTGHWKTSGLSEIKLTLWEVPLQASALLPAPILLCWKSNVQN